VPCAWHSVFGVQGLTAHMSERQLGFLAPSSVLLMRSNGGISHTPARRACAQGLLYGRVCMLACFVAPVLCCWFGVSSAS